MAQRKYNDPVTFDTLSYAKKLQAAGFTPEQAEVQAETFLAIVQEQLVNKRDLKEVEKELKIEIENVRKELKEVEKELKIEIENVRKELKEVEKELKIEIENVRKELKIEIENVRKEMRINSELLLRDLKIWFGGMLVIAVTLLSGMMTLIVHLGS